MFRLFGFNRFSDDQLVPSKIEYTHAEKIMDIASIIILLGTFAFISLTFDMLPEKIPTHFGFDGRIDGVGSKETIWFLFGLNLFLFILLSIVRINPRFWNRPFKCTPETINAQYRAMAYLLTTTKLIVVILVSYLIYTTIRIATVKDAKLGFMFFIILGALFANIIFWIIKSYNVKNSDQED